MFTGLVEEKGALLACTPRPPSARVRIGCAMGPLVLGESISVDGVCLTVDTIVERGFEADCSQETLTRTTLGTLRRGAPVNLERAVPLGGRMGGHIVSGHVDGTGVIADRRPLGDAIQVTFTMPPELARYVAEKGSICVSGVSLTVNEAGPDWFRVVLIPHTLQKTSLDGLAVGARVNLEVDVLARYVARLLSASIAAGGELAANGADGGDTAARDSAFLERLRRAGFA